MTPILDILANRSGPTLCDRVAKATNTVSTITNVPSNNKPKSKEPIEIKFAGNPWIFSIIMANKNESGITEATIKVDFQLYRKINTIRDTSKTPSTMFFDTVLTVLSTNFVRSTAVSILTLSGNVLVFNSSIFSLSNPITSDGFSPLNMTTIPSTTSSCSLYPTRPNRGLLETTTSATFLIKTGVEPFNLTVIFPISSILSNNPTPRTT